MKIRRSQDLLFLAASLLAAAAFVGAYLASSRQEVINTRNNNGSGSGPTFIKPSSWPPVQQLKDSGLSPVSNDELKKCTAILELPQEIYAKAHPSNFGNREPRDAIGRSIPNQPAIVIIHETVIPAAATINLFQTNHLKDSDQASYHLLINRAGERIRVVPDGNRAYGSGYSAFGDFTIHAKNPESFSINNVALHVSLESPSDGAGDNPTHSGYTRAQYDSLAKQVLLWQAKYRIPIFRVTTHASVDRSHSRYDPRSFSLARWDLFDRLHKKYSTDCNLSQFALPD